MSTCGYVCPQCEGRGFTDNGQTCNWCSRDVEEDAVPGIPSRFLFYSLHKPYGYLSQFVCEAKKKKLLGDLYAFPERIMPVGRLDEDSEGLLLLSNYGPFHKHLLAHKVEKEYWVFVEGEVTDEAISKLQNGIDISYSYELYRTRPCQVKRLGEVHMYERFPRVRYHPYKGHTWLSITLKEGKHRQVRKMCAAAGYPVLRLIRKRVGGLWLPEDSKPGDVRQLNAEEVRSAGLLPA